MCNLGQLVLQTERILIVLYSYEKTDYTWRVLSASGILGKIEVNNCRVLPSDKVQHRSLATTAKILIVKKRTMTTHNRNTGTVGTSTYDVDE